MKIGLAFAEQAGNRCGPSGDKTAPGPDRSIDLECPAMSIRCENHTEFSSPDIAYGHGMGDEAAVIAASERLASPATLARDLAALGLAPGGVTIVHSSMSKLGWVVGGAQSVVEALRTTVGADGTVVMPTQSGQLTDPAGWNNPAIPDEWIEEARNSMPVFDPDTTLTRGMGAIVESFRGRPGVRRSAHPHTSFAADGPRAQQIVGDHQLASKTGESSPLARLYDLDAQVLLLGVDHANNTSLHLAEERATWAGKSTTQYGGPVLVEGKREWLTWEDLDTDDGDFAALGEEFAATGAERSGQVGAGIGRLFSQREVVDFAVAWLTTHRPESLT